jgi:hypothetical protein
MTLLEARTKLEPARLEIQFDQIRITSYCVRVNRNLNLLLSKALLLSGAAVGF